MSQSKKYFAVGFFVVLLLLISLLMFNLKSISAFLPFLQTESSLFVWPVSRIDQKILPLNISYASPIDTQVTIVIKGKEAGSQDYHTLKIESPVRQVKKGQQVLTVKWEKKEQFGKSVFDLLVEVHGPQENINSFLMKNIKLYTRKELRNQIENYLIYYGKLTEEQIDFVKEHYQLVILDLRNGLTAEQVARIRAGRDVHDATDDVLVLGYISIGEDLRTAGMTIEELRTNDKFVMNGTGPSIDPREGAPFPQGGPFDKDIPLTGKRTNGGFAPFYLNDNYVTNGTGNKNVPDINANFRAAFVNPGHPEWLKAMQTMTLEQDGIPGMNEILSADYGLGFACDGLFLDTLDTAAPNYFTDKSSWNQGEFEWVSPGTQKAVQFIREKFPEKLQLANRGLFFYNPDLPMFKFTLRPYVDFVFFESYYLDSSADHNFDSRFFADNKYNYAQKVLAEADRADGFRVLSLGYAEGPEGSDMKQAMSGQPNETGDKWLEKDIEETRRMLGMVHYITNAAVTDINTYVKDHYSEGDLPPAWGSTETPVYNQPYPQPRAGIQNVGIRDGEVYVQWDVAHASARPIQYTLYVREGNPFVLENDIEPQSTLIVRELSLDMPEDYPGKGDRSTRYPYEAKVKELNPGKVYYLIIRASNANGVMEKNTVMLKVDLKAKD